MSVAFSSDNTLAIGSLDSHIIRLWNTEAGNFTQILNGHKGHVKAVAFKGRSIVASGSFDSTVQLWDTDTGVLLRTLFDHTSYVLSIAFNEGNLLASGSSDNTIKLWTIDF